MSYWDSFEDAKQEIVAIAEEISLRSFEADAQQIRQRLDLMRLLLEVQAGRLESQDAAIPEGCPLSEFQDKRSGLVIGQLRRSLIGGHLGSFRVFMPEKRIRELQADEGDWIRAKVYDRRHLPNGTTKSFYDYELLRKAESEEPSERRESRFSQICRDAYLDEFYVRVTDEDGEEVRVTLDSQLMTNLRLLPDQLVDFAYWSGQLEDGRISWKYQPDFVALDSIELDEELEDELAHPEQQPSDILAEQRVIYVGQVPEGLADAVQARGGELISSSGEERYAEVEEAVHDVDMVLFCLPEASHSALYKYRNACRCNEVPIAYFHHLSLGELLQVMIDPPEEMMAAFDAPEDELD